MCIEASRLSQGSPSSTILVQFDLNEVEENSLSISFFSQLEETDPRDTVELDSENSSPSSSQDLHECSSLADVYPLNGSCAILARSQGRIKSNKPVSILLKAGTITIHLKNRGAVMSGPANIETG